MAAEPGTVQFSIGRVIGDSFGVYARNFISFTALALLIGLLDLLFALFVVDQTGTAQMDPTQTDPAMMQPDYGMVALSAFITMIVGALTQAAIIYGTLQDLRGQKAGIGDCIARGLSAIVPVIVGSILLALGVGVGMMLLIIPGVILALMWWVYVPTIVVEGKGIIEAFGRSRELTRGRRWHLLGLLVIVVVLTILVGVIVQFISGMILMSSADGSGWTLFSILQYAFMSLVTAFNAVLVAVGYYYLRAEKEGIDVNEIARIFD